MSLKSQCIRMFIHNPKLLRTPEVVADKVGCSKLTAIIARSEICEAGPGRGGKCYDWKLLVKHRTVSTIKPAKTKLIVDDGIRPITSSEQKDFLCSIASGIVDSLRNTIAGCDRETLGHIAIELANAINFPDLMISACFSKISRSQDAEMMKNTKDIAIEILRAA